MPRPPRCTYAQALHHVTLRCNNREFLFEEPWFTQFTRLVQEARAKVPIRLYHYCLMTNHMHLLFHVVAMDRARSDAARCNGLHYSVLCVRRVPGTLLPYSPAAKRLLPPLPRGSHLAHRPDWRLVQRPDNHCWRGGEE